jgi:cytochrome d ubiquinol oxidase subunit II
METLWFWLVAAMITAYVVLDGYDIGAGIIHLGVARNDAERSAVLASIGPFWDANEVWLLAAGGTLYFAFPELYAASFSGFYLPLMVVLWLLILRGVSIEFRGHIDNPVWKPVWDVVFMGASALLALFFGAALGNVIRGVPLDAQRNFFLPLWTHFGVGGAVGILDWYTLTIALCAYLALTHHGACWVAYKASGEVRRRALHIAAQAWWGVLALSAAATVATLAVQPNVWANLTRYPAGFVFPAVGLAGLGASYRFRRSGADLKAFLGSCAFLAGMLTSAVFGVYPYVLPSNRDPALGLTIDNAAAPAYGLGVGLTWWIPGILLVTGYFFYVYRHFRGRVGPS